MSRPIITIIAVVLLLCQCTKSEKTIELGNTTSIPFKESRIYMDNKSTIEVAFIDLEEESRCPEDAICAWAGRAIIKLQINQTNTIRLGIGDLRAVGGDTVNGSIMHDNRRYTLKGLDYGDIDNYLDKNHYVAKILVE